MVKRISEKFGRRRRSRCRRDILIACALGTVCTDVDAFSALDFRTKTSYLSTTSSVVIDNILDEGDITCDVNGRDNSDLRIPGSRFSVNESSQDLSVSPKWLERYSEFAPEQVGNEMRRLEYRLLEQGFCIKDISLIIEDIYMAANGNSALAIGIVEFLKTMLSLQDNNFENAAFLSTPVLLASIAHFANSVALQPHIPPYYTEDCSMVSPVTSLALPPAIKRSTDVISKSTMIVLSPHTDFPLLADYKEEVESIIHGAARIKRAELLVHAILKDRAAASSNNVRNLLLSVMTDWRSLGIRVVASLYRLECFLEYNHGTGEYLSHSPEVVHTAKEALKIYAPLAQRLGLQKLKARIEAKAFRILYRRQYKAASSIFRDGGDAMNALSSYLRSHIALVLEANEPLMSQVDYIEVVSRVKEPYSFWKKYLKNGSKRPLLGSSTSIRSTESSALAISRVNDGVAVRVIIKAKKVCPTEDDETIRSRENLLCYYVQNLICDMWPDIETGRFKDYILNPKPNGYQSLHHTSKIVSRGVEFPFEVQVRSEEMHRLAEFGVAAHWDYKLGSATAHSALKDAQSPTGALSMVGSQSQHHQNDANGKEPKSYVEALVVSQEEISRKHVHVFVVGGEKGREYGELICLPFDSPISSVAAEIEKRLSAKIQVWRNGRIAEMCDTLENGDVVLLAL